MTKVSILIAVYNAENKIAKTIASIKSQTLIDFECVIVDDGSSDNTLEYLKSINDKRFKIIKSPHIGLTKSLNLGLKKCCGKYIARIDADDISSSNRIEVQSNFLDNHPEISVVGSDVELFDKKNKFIKKVIYPTYHNKILKMYKDKLNPLPHSSLLIRKDTLDIVKGYREFFERAQDYDLVLRLSELGKISNIRLPLCKLRHDNNSISNNINGTLQIEYCLMALASYYIRNITEIDPIESQSQTLFLQKFKNWYKRSKYNKIFFSKIARNNMKVHLANKNIYLFLSEVLVSLYFDFLWPIRGYLGYDRPLKKWIKKEFDK